MHFHSVLSQRRSGKKNQTVKMACMRQQEALRYRTKDIRKGANITSIWNLAFFGRRRAK